MQRAEQQRYHEQSEERRHKPARQLSPRGVEHGFDQHIEPEKRNGHHNQTHNAAQHATFGMHIHAQTWEETRIHAAYR